MAKPLLSIVLLGVVSASDSCAGGTVACSTAKPTSMLQRTNYQTHKSMVSEVSFSSLGGLRRAAANPSALMAAAHSAGLPWTLEESQDRSARVGAHLSLVEEEHVRMQTDPVEKLEKLCTDSIKSFRGADINPCGAVVSGAVSGALSLFMGGAPNWHDALSTLSDVSSEIVGMVFPVAGMVASLVSGALLGYFKPAEEDPMAKMMKQMRGEMNDKIAHALIQEVATDVKTELAQIQESLTFIPSMLMLAKGDISDNMSNTLLAYNLMLLHDLNILAMKIKEKDYSSYNNANTDQTKKYFYTMFDLASNVMLQQVTLMLQIGTYDPAYEPMMRTSVRDVLLSGQHSWQTWRENAIRSIHHTAYTEFKELDWSRTKLQLVAAKNKKTPPAKRFFGTYDVEINGNCQEDYEQQYNQGRNKYRWCSSGHDSKLVRKPANVQCCTDALKYNMKRTLLQPFYSANDIFSREIEAARDCRAFVYQHGNFGGWSATFKTGVYNQAEFMQKGARNEHISSMKITGTSSEWNPDHPSNLVVVQDHSSTCPEGYSIITSEAECRDYAVTIPNGKFMEKNTISHWPYGCFRYKSDGEGVYLGTNPAGIAAADHLLVCKKVPQYGGCTATFYGDQFAGWKGHVREGDHANSGHSDAMQSKHDQAAVAKIAPGSTIALKGGKSGRYCADEGNRMLCTRNAIGGSERFSVVDAGSGKIALRGGKDNRYCADEGSSIKCNRNKVSSHEKFTVADAGSGKIALRGGRDNRYCADEKAGVKCNRNAVGSWEKFTVECLQGCQATSLIVSAADCKATLYLDDLAGIPRTFMIGEYDIYALAGPYALDGVNDKVSSLEVWGRGCQVSLYANNNFQELMLTVGEGMWSHNDLYHDFCKQKSGCYFKNDEVSSLKVFHSDQKDAER